MAGIPGLGWWGAPRTVHARPAEAPRRILVVGSSLIVGALGRELEGTLAGAGFEVQRRARSASGLSRPDFYDWRDEVRAARRSFAFDGAVVMFGANDAQGIWTGGEPRWVRWPEPGWPAAYGARVAELADLLTEGGERLVWLGALPMRSRELDARMRRLDGIYAREMSIRPAARFVDTTPYMVDARGRFVASRKIDGREVKLRTPDGVHLTIAGARHLAAATAPELLEFLGGGPREVGHPADARCLSPQRR